VQADFRDAAAVKDAVNRGVAELGRLDIVLSNAGSVRLGENPEDFAQLWQDVVSTNLIGGFHTVQAPIPHLAAGGHGGSIVLTGPTAGVPPVANETIGALAYTASKSGRGGVCKQLAAKIAQHSVRVDTVHPTGARRD
jgi:NAD(P)-dependent dehydrogenase (short-subunit alcohol dehydrogenase family)